MIPLLSIIVPIYNVELYLPKCIDSILSQTYSNFEVILVDDGSTDSSGRICDSYASQDNRIKVFHKCNGGLSSARNAGIDLARGDYLGFVDSDDWVDNKYYEKLCNAIIAADAEIALARLFFVGEHGGEYLHNNLPPSTKFVSGEKLLRFLFLRQVDSSSCTKLFKSSVFANERFPMGKAAEDFAFLYKVLAGIQKGVIVSEAAYNYIARNGSITTSNNSSFLVDYYENALQMVGFIKRQKPRLVKEAETYFFVSAFELLRNLVRTNMGDKHHIFYRNIRHVLIKNFLKILANEYISMKYKIEIFFYVIHPGAVEKLMNYLKNQILNRNLR